MTSENNRVEKIGIFTVHKSASMLLHKLSGLCSDLKSIDYYSANNVGSTEKVGVCEFPDFHENNSEIVSRKYEAIRTGCIAPIRRPLKVAEDHPRVLVLRDPRDALTSMYFSFTKIHGGIPNEEREKRVSAGIDNFIAQRASDFFDRYNIYMNEFLDRPLTTFLRYEDMFINPTKWIDSFCAPFELPSEDKAKVARYFQLETDTQNANEDKHKRRMLPGDYANHLSLESIDTLTSQFHNYLQYCR